MKLKIQSMGILCSLLLTLLVLGNCSGSKSNDDDDIKPSVSVEVSRFDGNYVVLMSSQGQVVAATEIKLTQGVFRGTLVNVHQQVVEVAGRVESNGKIVFEVKQVLNDPKATISAQGQIREDGILEGTFVLAGEQGTFTGFRNTENGLETHIFDGTYRIKFNLEGKEISVACISVSGGVFVQKIVNSLGETVNISGRVLASGNIILSSTISDFGRLVLGNGVINANKSVNGLFFLADQKGDFTGNLSPNCL